MLEFEKEWSAQGQRAICMNGCLADGWFFAQTKNEQLHYSEMSVGKPHLNSLALSEFRGE